MEKKHKLLFRYIEILKDNIDDMFDGLVIEDKEIYSLQTEILDSDGKVHDLKQMIDTFFKRKMVDYLNNKYKLMKDNKFYRNTDYGLFGFEYELIDTTFDMNDYRVQAAELETFELNNSYTDDDCKKIVLDFYKDLFKNDDDVKTIEKLIDSIIFIDEGIRSYYDIKDKKIYVSRYKGYEFLLTIAHEVAHAYAFSKTSSSIKDTRLMEMDSLCIEALLMKYLKDNQIECLQSEDGPSTVEDYVVNNYFMNLYSMLVFYARDVLDEMSIVYCIGNNDEEVIDLKVLENVKNILPYSNHYMIYGKKIDEFIDRYLITDSEDGVDTFSNNVSYICSVMFQNYFYRIIEKEETKEKFVEYLRQPDGFAFDEFISLFNTNPYDFFMFTSILMTNFKKEVGDSFIISERYKEEVEKDLEDFENKIEEEFTSNSTEKLKFIGYKRLSRLLRKPICNEKIYPFDIEYQLDDNEVDLVNKEINRILRLNKKQ